MQVRFLPGILTTTMGYDYGYMGTDTKTARDIAGYVFRFARLSPELTIRAMRKENIARRLRLLQPYADRAVGSLDRTEAFLTYYCETLPIRHAERFEQWWNDTLHMYADG